MKNQLFIFLCAFLVFIIIVDIDGHSQPQIEKPKNQLDPAFPDRSKFQLGFISTYSTITPPPVVIADVMYGISRKFSIGVVAGTTGAIALYGIRFNSILLQQNRFKVQFRMTSIYYPSRDGKFLFDRKVKKVMPWMLSMGVIDAEWKTNKNVRWSIGMGLLETHCVDDMKEWFDHSSEFHHIDYPELFQILNGSVSIPLSSRVTLRPEVIAVMKGGELIEKEKYKVPFPINPYLNLIIKL